jgi:hypothetical protein
VQNRISNHIRSNIVGYIALFLFAMGGSAYALDGPLPGQNQVGSDDIINGEVKTADIGTGEVKNGDIGAFEINANNIAPDSLGGTKIADRQVKNADLGLGASSSNTIRDGGIEAIDVKANTLTGGQIDELSLDPNVLQRRISATCAAGQAIREVAQNGTVTCETVGGGGGASWLLAGNAGTTGADFLGTTDNQPLNLRVNNARGLRIEPASDGTNQSPNVIGGIADNQVTAGVHSAVISGGGRGDPSNPATANTVTDSYGAIGGGAANRAGDSDGSPSDASFATVGGGGDNDATGQAATVGGGNNNSAGGSNATVAGGALNFANQASATIAGGSNNTASGSAASVSGGGSNTASGDGAAIGGGVTNTAIGDWAAVVGGQTNNANGNEASVVGGAFNTAQGDFSLAGGLGAQANQNGAFVWADSNPVFFGSTAQDQFNVRSTGGARLVSGIDGPGNPTSGLELPANTSGWSTLVNGQPFDIRVNNSRGLRIDPASDGTNQSPNVIGGIADNAVTAGVHSAVIGGGGRGTPADPTSANRVTDHQGTVGGGANNQAGNNAGTVGDATLATVAGGGNNSATGEAATVAGGFSNLATANRATVGGGDTNHATDLWSTVAGGLGNTASNQFATVGGGSSNTATQGFATVPGGLLNDATAARSFAAGTRAKANHQGAFVWADSQNADMASSAADQFIARAQGHFFLQSDSTLDNQSGFLNTSTGAFLSTGGAWTNASDKHLKAGFERVDPKRVLKRVEALHVGSWHYKAEPSVRHIGPVAQDFYRAFHVGEDNKHIATVDADGVALAAIKGLSRKVERLQRKVASLKRAGSG